MSGVSRGHILITTDAVGGVWSYSCTLARAWHAQGIGCSLAVFGPSPTDAQREDAAGIALIETGFPLDWTAAGPADIFQAAAALGDLAWATRVTSLHVHSAALVPVHAPGPVVAVAHSCPATWWRVVRGGEAPLDIAWRARLIGAGLTRADAIIAPSASFAVTLSEHYGIHNIQVVHNGAPPPPPPKTRAAHVVGAGRLWDEGKNFRTLDAALAGTETDLILAGAATGPHGQTFAPQHARLTGQLAAGDVRALVATAAVFAAPSLYEPFGLAVLEAAQAGTPLVLADIATFRELWAGAALFVSPHDQRAWCAAIGAARRQAETLGSAARARAARYTLARMAANTLAIHHGAVASSLRGAA